MPRALNAPEPTRRAAGAFTARLEVFRDRLLQLDWRNRSILMRRPHKRWSFDLGAMGPLLESIPAEAVEKAIAGEGRVTLVLDSDSSQTAQTLRSSLTQVERSLRLLFEESGLDDCFLGFPFIVGHLGPDKYVRAPVVLFPVAIERVRRERGSGWYLTFSPDEPPVLNRALLAAIRKVRGVSALEGLEDALAEILIPPAPEPLPADPERPEPGGVLGFLRRLHKMLDEGSIPLVDEPPSASTVAALEPLTQESIAALPQERLRLVPHAVAGSFPQGSTAIYGDYEALIERAQAGESNQGIVDDLLEAPAEVPPNEPRPELLRLDGVPDRRLNFALPTDGSQDAVLVEAQLADCVVVRGPPGTGKSQVIVNLITDALARGERALLVCQKRAALDVVFQRLERAGLSDAAILLHDARADRPAQYKRLARRMEGAPPPVDDRFERVFAEATDLIDKTIAELNELVKPLWTEAFGGVRPCELYAAATPGYVPRLAIPLPADAIGVADLKAALDALPRLQEGWKRFDAPGSPLRGRRSFAAATFQTRAEFQAGLDAVKVAAVDVALYVGDRAEQAEFLESARTYNKLKDKALRGLMPAWQKASRRVTEFIAAHPSEPRCRDAIALEASLEAGTRLEQAVDGLGVWLVDEGLLAVRLALADPPAVQAKVEAIGKGLSAFEAAVEHDRRAAALSSAALALCNACTTGLADTPEPWGPTLKQEVYLHWIRAFEAGHPQMGGEPFERYLELRDRLSRLIEERRGAFVAQLTGDLARRSRVATLPLGEQDPKKRPDAQWKKLAYEFGKQRRVKSVRRLIDEFPHAFLQVAPCWLASPEAVSDVFPLRTGLFDLVVFDEASQLAVERALPAIYRGKRAVIAGDEKQLRPFDLFQMRGEDEGDGDEDEAVTEAESLLVLAMRIFSPRYLSWHYRSKYQELIDFSNHAFYEGNLQIAANVQRAPGVPPIEFVRVGGTWKDRKNAVEAEHVVDVLKGLLQTNEGRGGGALTLGVITFNDQQRDLILDVIDARRSSDAEFDRLWSAVNGPDRLLDERPFVKNLENVQGDERDIILFSVGYGPGPDGKLRVQFGSLSQLGGENRLNVAVTRARQKVIMVASFDPKDLPTEGTTNQGPQRLKQYLLYAQAVSKMRKDLVESIIHEIDPAAAAAGPTARPLTFEKPFETQLKESLEAAGLKVDRQVGFSDYRLDLAVAHPTEPGRYVMGIECDGATFHSARSARERDVERQRFLETHGWKVERAWSRNWWRDREGELARLQVAILAASGGAPGAERPLP
jgi:very-short-patch-repair endonuclease